jgi:hypothetical protein
LFLDLCKTTHLSLPKNFIAAMLMFIKESEDNSFYIFWLIIMTYYCRIKKPGDGIILIMAADDTIFF